MPIRDALLPEFDLEMANTRKMLERVPESNLDFKPHAKPGSLKAGGRTIFTMPRSAVLRSFVMNHLIHHRAQLGVHLRLNGVPVAGTYGPSADEHGG